MRTARNGLNRAQRLNKFKMITLTTYYIVFGALLALTLLTTGMAFVDLGAHWNIAFALAIAVVKASLVAAYFMHLRHS